MVAIPDLLGTVRYHHHTSHLVAFCMNSTALTLLRGAATAVIAGLTAAIAYYPDQHWIAPVIAALAVYGIHAIPTANQTPLLPPSTNPSIPENTEEYSQTRQSLIKIQDQHQPFTGE